MRSSLGSAEVPCLQCGTRVAGLGWGDRCPACLAARERRARTLATRISLLATVLTALYVWLRVPALPMARLYGAIAVVSMLLLSRRIVHRVAMEFLPN